MTLKPRDEQPEEPQGKMDAFAHNLKAKDAEELRQLFITHAGLTIENLHKTGIIYREMISRGIDTSDINIPFGRYLMGIAEGKIDPRPILRFGHRPGLLQKVTALPIKEQQRLSSGGDSSKVLLVIDNAKTGEFDHILCDPLELQPDQWPQVFTPDGIRTEGAQKVYLADRRSKGLSGRLKVEVVFTSEEMDSIKTSAKRQGVSPAELLKDLARGAGVIS